MGQTSLFCLFSFFQQQFYSNIVDNNGNRTRIVGVEGDHLTTITALA